MLWIAILAGFLGPAELTQAQDRKAPIWGLYVSGRGQSLASLLDEPRSEREWCNLEYTVAAENSDYVANNININIMPVATGLTYEGAQAALQTHGAFHRDEPDWIVKGNGCHEGWYEGEWAFRAGAPPAAFIDKDGLDFEGDGDMGGEGSTTYTFSVRPEFYSNGSPKFYKAEGRMTARWEGVTNGFPWHYKWEGPVTAVLDHANENLDLQFRVESGEMPIFRYADGSTGSVGNGAAGGTVVGVTHTTKLDREFFAAENDISLVRVAPTWSGFPDPTTEPGSGGGGGGGGGAISTVIPGAVAIAGAPNWFASGWFGDFAELGGGWIYHEAHRDLFVAPNSGGFWLWSESIGWMWTDPDVYPNLWFDIPQSWVWFDRSSNSPRWFFDYESAEWESRAW